ncbi:MAG: recombinase family protein, partial [Clostridia bacterium]|nr:recombinase family protein [Clostridia bacterium]
LEERQKELTIEITQEQIKRPALTKEQILFGIHKFRKYDISTKDGKERLIDCFVNNVYLFDDYALITCNFKEGTTKITLDDI